MELIYTDDKYDPRSLVFFQSLPVLNDMYTIRELINYPNGDTGVLLNEVVNKPIEHYSGMGTYEPSFNIKRFSRLNGDAVSKEAIKEFKRNKVKAKI